MNNRRGEDVPRDALGQKLHGRREKGGTGRWLFDGIATWRGEGNASRKVEAKNTQEEADARFGNSSSRLGRGPHQGLRRRNGRGLILACRGRGGLGYFSDKVERKKQEGKSRKGI